MNSNHPKHRRYLVLLTFSLASVLFGQTNPPMPLHRSAITPPVILFSQPIIRRHPTNTVDLHLPPGKQAELFQLANMPTDELLERVRTNRGNLFLLELRNTAVEDLVPVMVTPADLITLSNLHLSEPQHP